jgi:hypothetical protein
MPTLWTPRQASRTLPLVKRIVSDILERGREWRALTQDGGETAASERAEQLEEELADLMRELEGIGCYYKDWGFDMGLIDFPARIDGQPVFLCWRSDEAEIAWFHPVNEGFAGRQPIPAPLLE